MKHRELKITYKHHKPYRIRDKDGYLLFFPPITQYPGQPERYRNDIEEQFALADFLLQALAQRPNTGMKTDTAIALDGDGESSTRGAADV